MTLKTMISYSAEVARQAAECALMEWDTCLHQTRWISDILGQTSMRQFMGVNKYEENLRIRIIFEVIV